MSRGEFMVSPAVSKVLGDIQKQEEDFIKGRRVESRRYSKRIWTYPQKRK